MFDEVVNRPSRWRAFWPEVDDLSGAQDAIRMAAWCAYVTAGLMGWSTLIGALAGTGVLPFLPGGLFFGLLGLGVRREWRTAAVVGTTFMLLAVTMSLAQNGVPEPVSSFLLVGWVNGVRGTFAARRLRAAITRTHPGSPVLMRTAAG